MGRAVGRLLHQLRLLETQELEPWQEDGESWRRLHVTFPRSIATHSTEQIFYSDADFMQRRMDYAVAVNRDVLVAQYQHEPKTFRGLVFPTQHRVHRRSPDGTADRSQTSITSRRARRRRPAHHEGIQA